MPIDESKVMANDLPEGFVNWVLGGVATIFTGLCVTVTTLWRINESKNSKAIEEQSKQIVGIESELKTVRDHARMCDDARIVCERDRAVLTAKCEIFEKRLTEVEKKTA